MTKKEKIYRVLFRQNQEIYEVYVNNVYQGNMHGFIEIENFVYGERTRLVDPVDEKLRSEFKGVERSYIPHFSIIRIDEVTKKGINRIHKLTKESAPLNHPHHLHKFDK